MDAVILARLQFAITVGFHFIFPSVTIGLAWLLVILERIGWKQNDAEFVRIARFFARLFAITFAVGVATGVVMEFQFGTNWAEYSKFVGDIFGAPLAAEGIFAFFLESGFLGLYLFGRGRVSPRLHWFSILMVAVGATISAFWIIVANSWQQTPAGFAVDPATGRAVLTDFWAAVFNASTVPRFIHTVDAALVTGAFFMAGVCAALILRGRDVAAARKALRVSVVFGLIAAVLSLFPTGHVSAQQVARTQPEKFAAIEGLYLSRAQAPLVLAAVPRRIPPQWVSLLEIPGLLSFMAFGDFNAHIQGIDAFPPENVPNLLLTFATFHTMVGLGLYFIAAMAWAAWRLRRGDLHEQRWFLRVLVWSIPLPIAACQIGWITAEVGRQPWIVYHTKEFAGLRTSAAVSQSVLAGEVLFSLLLFSTIYLLLGALYLYLIVREVRRGPQTAPTAVAAPADNAKAVA